MSFVHKLLLQQMCSFSFLLESIFWTYALGPVVTMVGPVIMKCYWPHSTGNLVFELCYPVCEKHLCLKHLAMVFSVVPVNVIMHV